MSAASGNVRDNQGAGDPGGGRLLHDAVQLVERALTASRSEGPEPVGAPDAAPPLIGDKVRCEASMLLRAAAAVANRDPKLPAALARLAAELVPQSPDELAVRLCLHPGIALDLALVLLHLRALGLGDPRLEPLLGDLLGTDRLRGPERQPNRELEQLWLHGLWSGEVEPTSLARTLSASSLAWEFDHLAGTTEDAYAFTHAILYATDHGRRRVALPRPVEEIVRDADAILAMALDAGNHDVTAEVLWTWPMLDLPWTPLAAEARAFLAQVSDACGFLPGPGFDPSVHKRLPFPERDAYVLRTSYHTTLVHGLLLAATLSREGRLQPGPAAGQTGSMTALAGRNVADAVTAFLQPSAMAVAWWTQFPSLPPATRDSLAPALVTMALRRAATAADMSAVQETLSLAAEYRLSETPVTRQARVLLRRAMTCAELAGVAAVRS